MVVFVLYLLQGECVAVVQWKAALVGWTGWKHDPT